MKCADIGCANEARYISGLCGIHDLALAEAIGLPPSTLTSARDRRGDKRSAGDMMYELAAIVGATNWEDSIKKVIALDGLLHRAVAEVNELRAASKGAPEGGLVQEKPSGNWYTMTVDGWVDLYQEIKSIKQRLDKLEQPPIIVRSDGVGHAIQITEESVVRQNNLFCNLCGVKYDRVNGKSDHETCRQVTTAPMPTSGVKI
jgi:hypothetical protein